MNPKSKAYCTMGTYNMNATTTDTLQQQTCHTTTDVPFNGIALHLRQTMTQDSNLTNIAICKAAASNPGILSLDKAICDTKHLDNWKMAASQEISGLEEKKHGLKSQSPKQKGKFYLEHGYFAGRELHWEKSRSSRRSIVSRVIS